jgi:hypothetical protein
MNHNSSAAESLLGMALEGFIIAVIVLYRLFKHCAQRGRKNA